MRAEEFKYEDLITIASLFQAWEEFRKEKKKKADVLLFERHLEDNLFKLRNKLKAKTYTHGGYETFYVRDPKVRHIHKACVEDRVVHHLTSKILEQIFDKTFYEHSYSCRKNKGTHKAVNSFALLARRASKNNTSSLYILKCDIKKFFHTVDHALLTSFLKRKINSPDFMWLLTQIICSFKSEFTISGDQGKGMPIGNLSSQIFANIYLDPLDKFIKHDLKVKFYLRYADDFIIMHQSKEYLDTLVPRIESYLDTVLQLKLHPGKIKIRSYYLGIDFLGYVIFPHFVIPRTKTKKRLLRKIYKKVCKFKQGSISDESLEQSIQSYLGYLSHANAFRLSKDLKNKIWFWLTE